MTTPALQMLLERMLSPIPRVRWETGRSVAWLIRRRHTDAANALLGWIGSRRLESEVILGLGTIDAFRLGEYFDVADLCRAVRGPSLLSDYLLRKNFRDVRGLSLFRYSVSPHSPALLSREEKTWFNRYRKVAVPGIYSVAITQLQEATGLPFMARWEHDWQWLQATVPRPQAEFPAFFAEGDRGRSGSFMVGQTELYVSAYLRTLAFAAIRGWISKEVAERHAMLGLTMNAGLADLEPIDRPDWARGLLPWEPTRSREHAQKLWTGARTVPKPGETPLALRVVDVDAKGFVELEMTLVVGPRGLVTGPTTAKTLEALVVDQRPPDVAGLVRPRRNMTESSIEQPVFLTQQILPSDFGRLHGDTAWRITLASPYIFGATGEIQCRSTDVRFVAGSDVLSRWMHWYADWEPTSLLEMESFVGYISTVSESAVDAFRTRQSVDVAKLVTVRRGMRPEVWGEVDVEEETFWM